MTGEIHRALVGGYDCWNFEGVFATGVHVHIYAKNEDGKPGDELFGFRLDANDPRFLHDLDHTGHNGSIDVTFPEPFVADGDYFLSAQLEYDRPAMWPLWSANHVAPFGSPVQMRDNLAGGQWQQHEDMFGPSNFDFAFALYGLPAGPPPSNTVAECGEGHTTLLPLPDGATARRRRHQDIRRERQLAGRRLRHRRHRLGRGGPMITLGGGSVLALGNPSLYWNGTDWIAQPRLPDYDNYGFSSLQATGPCNAVGAAVVDIVGARRSVAIELKPIVYKNGFD